MSDGDYILGTRDDEVERLGLQHRVWRPRMLDGWLRAGITVGQTILDVGAGPGFAATDLAEIVGPGGRVIALERSPHFLAALSARAEARGISNIIAHEQDVSGHDHLGEAIADRSWCRWVLSFVAEPKRTVSHIARALKPGGIAIFHEYADYGAWQMLPPNEEVDRFRTLVIQSWRDAGGEPDVGLHLPGWLAKEGLEILEARPLIDVVRRRDFIWQWPAAFMATNAARLAELGYIEREEAALIATALERAPADALMVTPLVLEIIARKR
jgi:SAM-dependent methyltransferase